MFRHPVPVYIQTDNQYLSTCEKGGYSVKKKARVREPTSLILLIDEEHVLVVSLKSVHCILEH